MRVLRAGPRILRYALAAFLWTGCRLSTDTADVPDDSNPCLVPPVAGYKGLENQLYRVEIQYEGGLGTATFKWSRDNASVEARVVEVIDDSQIVVESLGKDDVLRFF